MPGFELARPGAASGASVVSATLNLPRVGAWSADLELGSSEALSGKVDLLIGDTRWVGTIAKAAVFAGVFRARMVAGGNGLRTKATPRHYTSPTIGVVLRDIATGVGEVVSSTASSGVTGTQLRHWTTISIPAAQAIRCLMDFAPPETVWRHLPDGTIWLGADAFEDSGISDFAEIGEGPEDEVVELQLVTPLIYPGTKIGGRKVDSAQVTVTGEEVRAIIWTAP
jgi:hypothetical protein